MIDINYYLFTADKKLIASNSWDIPEFVMEFIPIVDLYGIWVLIRNIEGANLVIQRFDTIRLPGEPRRERGVLVVKLGKFNREELFIRRLYSEVFDQLRKRKILVLEDIPEEIQLKKFEKDIKLIENALTKILDAYFAGLYVNISLPTLNQVDYPSLAHRMAAIYIYAKYFYPKGVKGFAYSYRYFLDRDIIWLSSAGTPIEEFLRKETMLKISHKKGEKIRKDIRKNEISPVDTKSASVHFQRPSYKFFEFRFMLPKVNPPNIIRGILKFVKRNIGEFAILELRGATVNVLYESPNFERTILEKFMKFASYEPKVLLFQDSEITWIIIHIEGNLYVFLMVEKDYSFEKDPDSVIIGMLKDVLKISRRIGIISKELEKIEVPEIALDKKKEKLLMALNAIEKNKDIIGKVTVESILKGEPASFKIPGFKFEHMDILDAVFMAWLYYRELPYKVPVYGYFKKSPPYPSLWFSDDGKIYLGV